MAKHSKKEKLPIARKARPRRTKRKVESAWDVLSSLAEKFPEGLGPFERDKSERDFEKYCRKDGKASHYPGIFTVLSVERAIRECKDHPTRSELHRTLGGSVTKKTLKDVLNQLEKSNKIIYAGNKIIWIASNRKLEAAIRKGRELT